LMISPNSAAVTIASESARWGLSVWRSIPKGLMNPRR
jgi:hypothetical protein